MEVQKLQPYEFEEINKRLVDRYGKFDNGFPYFRLIWSEDVLEKRIFHHTAEGFELLNPEVREVPKYQHYIKDRYILEGLVEIPTQVETDLITKISYEPIRTFETSKGEFLIPRWDAMHFILETIRGNQEDKQIDYDKVLGIDEDLPPEEKLRLKHERVTKLIEEIWE